MACLPMNDKVVDITQSTGRADAPKTKVYRSMIGNGRTKPRNPSARAGLCEEAQLYPRCTRLRGG